jgi:hypothetical protein
MGVRAVNAAATKAYLKAFNMQFSLERGVLALAWEALDAHGQRHQKRF